jgi:hypothetical protein
MSQLMATNPSTTLEHPGSDVVSGAVTPDPAPTPSAAEVASVLFPSDAGGVGYLFEHGVLDAVPTPLEDTPVDSPNQGAIDMAAVNEGFNAHVSPGLDIPTPIGPATDVPLSEPVAASAPQQSSFMATLAQEGARVKALFMGLGGTPSG